jgi:hypothetical protein
MKDISELSVSETKLFGADIIPFRSLVTATYLTKFTAPFVFKHVDIVEDDNKNLLGVLMNTGEFKIDDKVHPIEFLMLERAKIAFKMHANSEITRKFYHTVAEYLSGIDGDGQFKKNKPLIETMATTCVATLDFDYTDIFSKKMNSFISKDATKACAEVIEDVARIQILPRSLVFTVNYLVTEKRLLDNSARIDPKQLVLEPRVGVSLKERRYFTSSPTDSKTHLHLLAELEKSFKGTK